MSLVTTLKSALRVARAGVRTLSGQAAYPTVVPPAPPPQRPPRRVVNIRVEDTPNPHARKLVADAPVHEGPTRVVLEAGDADDLAVARAMFSVDGVRSLFIANQFVTVTRDPSAPWPELVPRLVAALKDVLEEG